MYTKKVLVLRGCKEWNAASIIKEKSNLSASAKSFQPVVKPENMTSSTGVAQQKIQKTTAPGGMDPKRLLEERVPKDQINEAQIEKFPRKKPGMDPSAFGGKSPKIKSNAQAAREKFLARKKPAGMDPSAFGGKSLKIKSNADAAMQKFLARKKPTPGGNNDSNVVDTARENFLKNKLKKKKKKQIQSTKIQQQQQLFAEKQLGAEATAFCEKIRHLLLNFI